MRPAPGPGTAEEVGVAEGCERKRLPLTVPEPALQAAALVCERASAIGRAGSEVDGCEITEDVAESVVVVCPTEHLDSLLVEADRLRPFADVRSGVAERAETARLAVPDAFRAELPERVREQRLRTSDIAL